MTNDSSDTSQNVTGSSSVKPTSPKPLALSASRAGDFNQCPLLYRFRAIDGLPEPTSIAQFRGTVVHAVLENLFQLPREKREPSAGIAMLPELFEKLHAAEPEPVVEEKDKRSFLNDCAKLFYNYYRIENPLGFDPDSCEKFVQGTLDDATPVRGFIDRIDIAPTGEVRIVDYKTGKKPLPRYSQQAHLQMELYSLLYWKVFGIKPDQMKLIYLKTINTMEASPSLDDLKRREEQLVALWNRIRACGKDGSFEPHTTKLCNWCAFQKFCPEYGGTPPEYPGWPGEVSSN